VGVGYPRDVEALLIIEVDGPLEECGHLIELITAIARRNRASTLR